MKQSHLTKSILEKNMQIAFKMKLKAGMADEYEKRHQAIWPELKQLIAQSGVTDYSIFLDKETNILFGVQKISGGAGSQDLGSHSVVKKWWAYMADIMETNPDNSPVTTPLLQMFHMD
jgi:L-rhamnose mutarotase